VQPTNLLFLGILPIALRVQRRVRRARAADREQHAPQYPPNSLRFARLRVRLLGYPRFQRFLYVRVEAQAYDRANAGARAAALVFLTVSYCARPRLLLTTTSKRTGARMEPLRRF